MKINTKHASYLEDALCVKSRGKLIDWLTHSILEVKKTTRIDAIAVIGTSGIVMGSIVSYATGIPLMVVRKSDENCHSGTLCESNFSVEDGEVHFVVIDDLISTGDTMNRLNRTIAESFDSYSRYPGVKLTYSYKGIFLYACGPVDQKDFSFKELDFLGDLCKTPTCKVYGHKN